MSTETQAPASTIKTVDCKKKTSPDCHGTITFDTKEHRFVNTCAACRDFNLKAALKRQHTARKLRPDEVGGNTNKSALRSLVVKTHKQVAEELGVSEARVQQLERDALIHAAKLLKSGAPIRTKLDEEIELYREYIADLRLVGDDASADAVEVEVRKLEQSLSDYRGTRVSWPEASRSYDASGSPRLPGYSTDARAFGAPRYNPKSDGSETQSSSHKTAYSK